MELPLRWTKQRVRSSKADPDLAVADAVFDQTTSGELYLEFALLSEYALVVKLVNLTLNRQKTTTSAQPNEK